MGIRKRRAAAVRPFVFFLSYFVYVSITVCQPTIANEAADLIVLLAWSHNFSCSSRVSQGLQAFSTFECTQHMRLTQRPLLLHSRCDWAGPTVSLRAMSLNCICCCTIWWLQISKPHRWARALGKKVNNKGGGPELSNMKIIIENHCTCTEIYDNQWTKTW